MAPEQIEERPGELLDGSADQFSLGVLLYLMLTGRQPFEAENGVAVFHKILREQPAPPSSVGAALPPSVDAVLLKALAKNPKNRYKSCSELVGALEQALKSKTVVPSPSRLSRLLVPVLATTVLAVGLYIVHSGPIQNPPPPPPAHGSLVFDQTYPVEVFINGASYGVVERKVEIPVGEDLDVELKSIGGKFLVRQPGVQVREGEETPMHLPVPPAPHRPPNPAPQSDLTRGVLVFSEPYPVEVIVDGKSYGVVERRVEVPAGTDHTVEIRSRTGESRLVWQSSVQIQAGEETLVSLPRPDRRY
jgi:serine/threonine protein kinase